jgi:hypothetical protein
MNVSPRPQEAAADEMNAREKRAAAIMLETQMKIVPGEK